MIAEQQRRLPFVIWQIISGQQKSHVVETGFNFFIALAFTVVTWFCSDNLWRSLGWPGDDPVPFVFSALISLCSMCVSFAVVESFSNWRRYGRRTVHLDKLAISLRPLSSTPIAKYAEDEIVSTIERSAIVYSGLVGGGAFIPLGKKMAIANALHDPSYGARTPRDRYWATTIDDPVDMIEDKEFFKKQARLPCLSRRRLVIMMPEAFNTVMSDRVRIKRLKEFLAWHRDNRFELRFLLEGPEKFSEAAQRYIFFTEPESILTDFAVFDDHHVFGAALRDAPSSKEAQRVHLIMGREQCVQYATFFEHSWDDKQAISREVIEEDCAAEEIRHDIADRIQIQYSQHFPGRPVGKEFFTYLEQHVSGASGKVVAVDIASLKDEDDNIAAWLRQPYLSIVNATASAARRGASCKRTFIIGGSLPEAKIESLVAAVFKPQFDAGVKIYFVAEGALKDCAHRPRDFIVIDGTIGFGLGRTEPFEPSVLSMKNLIMQEQIESLEAWASEWDCLAHGYPQPIADEEKCFEVLKAILARR